MTRLIHDFRMSRQFLYQLRSFYRREAYGAGADVQRTWRFQRRFNRILSGTRDREFQKLRAHLIGEMMGRRTAEVWGPSKVTKELNHGQVVAGLRSQRLAALRSAIVGWTRHPFAL